MVFLQPNYFLFPVAVCVNFRYSDSTTSADCDHGVLYRYMYSCMEEMEERSAAIRDTKRQK